VRTAPLQVINALANVNTGRTTGARAGREERAIGDMIPCVPGRRPGLVVRILQTVLLLFAPLLVSLGVVTVFPSLPEGIAKMLLLVSGAWLFSALILTPALLSAGTGSSSSPPNAGGGDDGGAGPRQPPSPSSTPRGGIPLPDADQARGRVRDHDRPGRRMRPRRPAPDPRRAPLPTLPDR
jgi:hypothetical protein